MQKLYFMRHGVTQANKDHRFALPTEPLSDDGRLQVQAAAQAAKASGLHIDLIITSPMPRAVESAKIIAAELGVPDDKVELSNFVRERDLGHLEGQLISFFLDGKHTYKDTDYVAGAEQVAALHDRARDVLQAIKERFEGNILVVSHDTFGRAFIRTVKHVPYTDDFEEHRVVNSPANAEIVQLI